MREKRFAPVLMKGILALELLTSIGVFWNMTRASGDKERIYVMILLALRCVAVACYSYSVIWSIDGLRELFTVLPFSKKQLNEILVFSMEKGLWIRSAVLMAVLLLLGRVEYAWIELMFLLATCSMLNIELRIFAKGQGIHNGIGADLLLCFVDFFVPLGSLLISFVAWNMGKEVVFGIRASQLVVMALYIVGYVWSRVAAKRTI